MKDLLTAKATGKSKLLDVLADGFSRLRTKLAYYLAPKAAASTA